MHKLALVVGTRPEVIKMAPVIKECQRRNIEFVLIHSNQHYSKNMDEVFFNELDLPKPKYNLEVGSGTHSNQTGNILIKLEPILEKEKPSVVLVQGDTNTVLASGLAATKLGIKVGHIEAGLRSYDRTMPEETNRVVTDHLSDFLFSVSKRQTDILKKEGVDPRKIFEVGNTIVDSVLDSMERVENSHFLNDLGLKKNNFSLVTIHRAGNVDLKSSLAEVLELIKAVHDKTGIQMVWPLHPRTRKKIEEFDIELPSFVKVIEPVGYSEFLSLQAHAKFVLTDSGGVQEECCILKTPTLTVRENTERPETIDVGANILVGRSSSRAVEALDILLKAESSWENPFGDGTSAKKIVDLVTEGKIRKTVSGSVSVVGLGYMGLPISLILSDAGWEVTGIDINEKKINDLKEGKTEIEEPGLDQLLSKVSKSSTWEVTTKLTKETDFYLISVPTPHIGGKCDLSFVEEACETVANVCGDKSCVILESTIGPGTMRNVVAPIFQKHKKNVFLAHCPERAIPGNTLHELVSNDRIVGGLDSESTNIAAKLFESFSSGKVHRTIAEVAEAAKLMENTYRDVNIALANEFDQVLTELGVPTSEAIQMANHHPRVNILSPGPGVGGHCIAVDPYFLIQDSSEADLIKTARSVNERRPKVIVNRFCSLLSTNVKKVGLLGVAYKPNVDDARETPALEIGVLLEEKGFEVIYHDPYVKNFIKPLSTLEELLEADAILEVTPHETYKSIRSDRILMRSTEDFR